jgi:hypothetical protein
MAGRASRDDLEAVYDDEVRAGTGAVTAHTTRRVEVGLRAALDVPG